MARCSRSGSSTLEMRYCSRIGSLALQVTFLLHKWTTRLLSVHIGPFVAEYNPLQPKCNRHMAEGIQKDKQEIGHEGGDKANGWPRHQQVLRRKECFASRRRGATLEV